MTSGDVLLEAQGISKNYGGIHALRDVSISVRAGEILGLVGPNGAGKTTLVDMITGHQIADTGEVTLKGEPLRGAPAIRARRGLGRTFQHPQLALELTVGENILVGAAAHRFSSAWRMVLGALTDGILPRRQELELVHRIGEEMNVGDLQEITANLSLGEQRLVEVARALAQNPTVMLLDEPFAGADAHSIEGIVDAIAQVKARGHGIILVDHNVDLLTSLADRVVLLSQGQVVFEGGPKECLASQEMQQVYFGAGETQ